MDEIFNKYAEMQHYYIDLIKVASTHESDVNQLMDFIEILNANWKHTKTECDSLRKVNKLCEEENGKLRCEIKETNARLIEARSQITKFKTASEELSHENDHLMHQVDLVRDFLHDNVNSLPYVWKKKLALLTCQRDRKPNGVINQSCSITANEIDYDKTEDSAFNLSHCGPIVSNKRKGKRSISTSGIPSTPSSDVEEMTPRKRSKGVIVTGFSVAPAHPPLLEPTSQIPLNRSLSEPHLGPPYSHQPEYRETATSQASAMAVSPALEAVGRRCHVFVSKSMIRKEMCDVCNIRFGFGKSSLQCEVCKYRCHLQCRDDVTTFCVGHGTSSAKNMLGKLASYVPRDRPMIPSIIVLCINEIEQRGLDTIGLYRLSGPELQVNELLGKFFNKRRVANLRLIDNVNVLTSCIKKFLQILKEPLIPRSSWLEFVAAAEAAQESFQIAFTMLDNAIVALPKPNLDTLAFLLIHLQRVAERSQYNKMPATNLAKIFGPAVVGYSTTTIDLQQAAAETDKQESVIKALMNLPPSYWTNVLTSADKSAHQVAAATFVTPEINVGAGIPISSRAAVHGTPNVAVDSSSRNYQSRFFQNPWKLF